ncbi:MAG: nuclear transport factor 2 family protein [Planctomycetota bacterium]
MASFAVAQDTTNKPATATTPATTVVAKPVSPEQLALETDAVKAIKQLTDALNAGNSDAVAGVFLPDGELIDDSGTVHLGHEEIKALVKAFQETYPGSKTDAQVESVRAVAGLVLVDGTRVITGKDGGSLSVIRFATIWKKTDAGLKLASLRDVSEALPPTPHEALEGLAWIVGEWINESGESKVSLNYRWDDNGNFIVGDINITSGDQVIMKSFQRIAWDASQGKYRSWTFDSDGGFGEGVWNATPNGLVLQNSAVGPDGLRGTATVKLVSDSKDRFTIQGIHRISEGMEAPDYQYTVVRKPPVAK